MTEEMKNSYVPEAQLVTGGAGTGKTYSIIEEIKKLISTENAGSIAVFCCSPLAVQSLKAKLSETLGKEKQDKLNITTPRAFALEILATKEATEITGRKARILNKTEEKFLMEDMKVSGIRTKRLREMLKFFYRSFTEMTNDEAGEWLISTEEEQIYSLLQDNLAFVQSYLECEVSATAYRLLTKNGDLCDRFKINHVFIDDYERLSRASQKLCCLVAENSLYVTGNEFACTEVYETYPYEKGFSEFKENYPHAAQTILDKCYRPKALACALDRLVESLDEDNNAKEGGPVTVTACATETDNEAVKLITEQTAAEELQAVAEYIAQEIERGTKPSDIVITVPNSTWAKNMRAACKASEIPCFDPYSGTYAIKGDVRTYARCTNARVLSLLDITADPTNALAWRNWCGYGDWLLCSGAISALRLFAERMKISFVEALAQVESDPKKDEFEDHAASMDMVLKAFRVARDEISVLQKADQALFGKALLDELSSFATGGVIKEAPLSLQEICIKAPCAGETDEQINSAYAMAARAHRKLLEPNCSFENEVLLVPYDNIAGLTPRILIIAGFVNGFIPSRDYFDTTVSPLDKQKKIHVVDTKRVYNLVGSAKDRLVISHFTSLELENAEILKVSIARIRMKNGQRICTISPSDFLKLIIGE